MLFTETPPDLEKNEEETRAWSCKITWRRRKQSEGTLSEEIVEEDCKNLVPFLKLTSGSERVNYVRKNGWIKMKSSRWLPVAS